MAAGLARPADPSWIAWLLGESNAPGGIMRPEFYNRWSRCTAPLWCSSPSFRSQPGVRQHFVPTQIGRAGDGVPGLNALSYWIYLVAGVIMMASFFVEGGAARSGWTSYAPLAVIESTGQSFWLAAVFLIGLIVGAERDQSDRDDRASRPRA